MEVISTYSTNNSAAILLIVGVIILVFGLLHLDESYAFLISIVLGLILIIVSICFGCNGVGRKHYARIRTDKSVSVETLKTTYDVVRYDADNDIWIVKYDPEEESK